MNYAKYKWIKLSNEKSDTGRIQRHTLNSKPKIVLKQKDVKIHHKNVYKRELQ